MIDTNEKAMSVYERMLEGTVREFSIGYVIVAEHRGTYGGKAVNYLDDVELLEVSVVTSGANRFTRLVEVTPRRRRTFVPTPKSVTPCIRLLPRRSPSGSARGSRLCLAGWPRCSLVSGRPRGSEATAFAFRERVV